MTDLSLLLDDAAAEAKRRGHATVVPAHLAIVVAAAHPGQAAAEWHEILPLADATLATLPVTYETPRVDPATEALRPVLKAGDIAAIMTAVGQAVRA